MRTIGLILIFFLVVKCFAQDQIQFHVNSFPIDKFSDWNAQHEDYVGTYQFGDSEWEWDLDFVISNSVICAQKSKSQWIYSNGQLVGAKMVYTPYNNLRIDGNKVFKSNGELLLEFRTFDNIEKAHNFEDQPDLINGILFYDGTKLEFGDYNKPVEHANNETFWNVLGVEDLANLDKDELQIMRNTIFARYGYIFKKGGEMERYFSKQSWYQPLNQLVNPNLTEIELRNIATIQKMEKR